MNQDQSHLLTPGSKINALTLFLKHFKAIEEKVVIVSSFTQTLDLIQILCEENQYSFKRLDGKTGVQLRSKYDFV
jgi:SNF2 family DNA or RNA helicase